MKSFLLIHSFSINVARCLIYAKSKGETLLAVVEYLHDIHYRRGRFQNLVVPILTNLGSLHQKMCICSTLERHSYLNKSKSVIQITKKPRSLFFCRHKLHTTEWNSNNSYKFNLLRLWEVSSIQCLHTSGYGKQNTINCLYLGKKT